MNAEYTRPDHDTTTMKVDSRFSPAGNLHGEYHLAGCKTLGMRMFRLNAGDQDCLHTRDYELAGYVLMGNAELNKAETTISLKPGDSYLVPADMAHSFKIIEEPFQCVEATTPPYMIHDRDRPVDMPQTRV